MFKEKLIFGLNILLLVFAIMQGYHYSGILAEKIAINFSMSGEPQNWIDKDHLITFNIFLTFFVFSLFTSFIILAIKKKFWLFNLPNKEYWNRSENQEETTWKLISFSNYILCITLIFLLFVFNTVYTKNTNLEYSQWDLFIMIGIYFALILLGVLKFNKNFKIPTD
ncbi:MAG: hypothetical protein C0425_05400 [Chlorobiaceae bacterium]|nr:hypothetical protein [Chlorobiaceae bacterium]MBA4309753.1 hypothetical protein [Chlorobiaceae bacterium]